MSWAKYNCPVCNEVAKEALPRMGDFVEIVCEANCGRYRITGTAMGTIRYQEPKVRRSLLESAKAVASADNREVPIITSYL
jgi:hypothetical protein